MPPMMPFIHDAFYFCAFAGVALFAWRATRRYDLRLSAFDWHLPVFRTAPSPWFTTRTSTRSGNTAFDEWRDGEIAKIEAQRRMLEDRLAAFEAFVDQLKRAKDRQTFERFMAERGDVTGDVADQHPA